MSSPESRFFSKRLSRRKFLTGGAAVAAGAAISSSLGVGPREAGNFLEMSYEYGPEVAGHILAHPYQSLEAYKLWKRPNREYEKLSFFGASLVYRKGAPNNIIGFGDSNLVGPDGTNWQESPIALYADMAQREMGVDNWNDYNCAKGGYTTDMIVSDQIPSARAKEGFGMGVGCDVWVNAGGNDVSNLLHNIREVNELRKLALDPFSDMDLLFKYTGRITDNIKTFGDKFLNLLRAIDNPVYDPQIRQFIIMSEPDYGKASSIMTQEFDGDPYIIYLKSPTIKRLIENISVRMNNTMFDSVAKFQRETGKRIIGINTAKGGISDFSSNQHYSKSACLEIAQTAFSRMDLTDA